MEVLVILLDRVKITGTGEPLILLHGMGGSHVLDGLEKALCKNYMVIRPIMYGFLSEDGIINYSDEYYVEFIEEIRVALKIEKWIVLGLSMGGRTAINYSISFQHRTSKLVLLNSVGIGYMNPLFRFKSLRTLFSNLIYTIMKYPVFQNAMGKPDFVNTVSEDFTNAITNFSSMLQDKCVRRNFSKILVKIGCPIPDLKIKLNAFEIDTLILWSKNDKTAPVDWAYVLKNEISKSSIFVLDTYKHMALLEKPQFYYDNIIAFLK